MLNNKRTNSGLRIGLKLIGIAVLVVTIFGSIPAQVPKTAAQGAGEKLEVRIHKNDPTGALWQDEHQPLMVEITENGNPVGINTDEAGIDSTQGGLYQVVDSQICTFTLSDGTIHEVMVDEVAQLPAGEFAVPPARIRSDKLTFESPPVCSGSDAEWGQFNTWWSSKEDNPFLRYNSTLSLPVGAGEYTVKIKEDSLVNTGFTCSKTVNGQTVTGICEGEVIIEAGSGEAVSLVVILDSAQSSRINVADTVDRLTRGDNAEYSGLVTFVGNFAIRTTSLLDWALGIVDEEEKTDNTGFYNPKIELIFNKFLNVANGLFILALLAIAFLWNFAILIPKDNLKKLLVLFSFGVLAINFALPFTRLLVNGTNIIQRTFLVKSGSETQIEEVQNTKIEASDILSAYDLDYGGFVGLKKGYYIEKNYPLNLADGSEVDSKVQANGITNLDDLFIDRYEERTYFNLALIMIGSIGQLLIALIIVFRIVILWFLLIFSPFLFILFIFHATRFVFRYWVWLYFRWLVIGPILAMSLFIIVNIWSLVGVPIESGYAAPSALIFPNTTNLYVAAPGVTSGYLSTPGEVMKYIAALMMLYMAIILPFWLTRIIPLKDGGKGPDGEGKASFFSKIKGLWSRGGTSDPKDPKDPIRGKEAKTPINLKAYKDFAIPTEILAGKEIAQNQGHSEKISQITDRSIFKEKEKDLEKQKTKELENNIEQRLKSEISNQKEEVKSSKQEDALAQTTEDLKRAEDQLSQKALKSKIQSGEIPADNKQKDQQKAPKIKTVTSDPAKKKQGNQAQNEQLSVNSEAQKSSKKHQGELNKTSENETIQKEQLAKDQGQIREVSGDQMHKTENLEAVSKKTNEKVELEKLSLKELEQELRSSDITQSLQAKSELNKRAQNGDTEAEAILSQSGPNLGFNSNNHKSKQVLNSDTESNSQLSKTDTNKIDKTTTKKKEDLTNKIAQEQSAKVTINKKQTSNQEVNSILDNGSQESTSKTRQQGSAINSDDEMLMRVINREQITKTKQTITNEDESEEVFVERKKQQKPKAKAMEAAMDLEEEDQEAEENAQKAKEKVEAGQELEQEENAAKEDKDENLL
jgi:hypothetical protein